MPRLVTSSLTRQLLQSTRATSTRTTFNPSTSRTFVKQTPRFTPFTTLHNSQPSTCQHLHFTASTMAGSDHPSPSKRSRTEGEENVKDIDVNNNFNDSTPVRKNGKSSKSNDKDGIPDAPKNDHEDGTQRPKRHDPDATSHVVESENKTDDWKHQPPYVIHDEGSYDPVYEASCHCGKVEFQLSREKPLDAKYCHCLTCQRLHGAPFQWAAIFHKTDLNFTKGIHDLVWYDPGSKSVRHQLPCKISCSHCRTPLMDEGRNMILTYPTLIKWAEGKKGEEDRKKFDASCHMFYSRRVVDVKDGKVKWDELNESSEKMDKSLW